MGGGELGYGRDRPNENRDHGERRDRNVDGPSVRDTEKWWADQEDQPRFRAVLDDDDRIVGWEEVPKDEPAETPPGGDEDVASDRRMPVDSEGRPAVGSDAYADWYREWPRGRDVAAPYDENVALRLLERPDERGLKTDGLMVDSSGRDVWDEPRRSAYDGPAKEVGWRQLRLPDRLSSIVSHVEAHAAAEMHLRDMKEATLYVNNIPCGAGKPDMDARRSCDRWLPTMLPPGAKLTVYAPDGFVKVYHGEPRQEQ